MHFSLNISTTTGLFSTAGVTGVVNFHAPPKRRKRRRNSRFKSEGEGDFSSTSKWVFFKVGVIKLPLFGGESNDLQQMTEAKKMR